MADLKDMQKRLEDLSHLQTPEELRDEVNKSEELVKKEVAEAKAIADPRSKRVYEFPFKYSLGTRLLEGEFQNTVPDMKTSRMIGLMRAHLGGGVAYERLDPFSQELFLMVAHLSYSLTKKPAWADDLLALDHTVLQALYSEVAVHEATFRGLRPDQG